MQDGKVKTNPLENTNKFIVAVKLINAIDHFPLPSSAHESPFNVYFVSRFEKFVSRWCWGLLCKVHTPQLNKLTIRFFQFRIVNLKVKFHKFRDKYSSNNNFLNCRK